MNHPNLSETINDNLNNAGLNGILRLKKLKDGTIVKFNTKNSHYKLDIITQDNMLLSLLYTEDPHDGGQRPSKETPVKIKGSTWGGSILMMDSMSQDMRVEMYIEGNIITTSPIQTITVEPAQPEAVEYLE